MPTESTSSNRTFRNVGRWTDLIGGTGCILFGIGIWAVSLPEERETAFWLSMAFLAFGVWILFRTFRHWNRPYLEFKDDILVVFDESKPQYVPRKLIVSHHTKWNATILVMEDSHQVKIAYGPFAWTREVKDFQNHFKQWMETGKNLN